MDEFHRTQVLLEFIRILNRSRLIWAGYQVGVWATSPGHASSPKVVVFPFKGEPEYLTIIKGEATERLQITQAAPAGISDLDEMLPVMSPGFVQSKELFDRRALEILDLAKPVRSGNL